MNVTVNHAGRAALIAKAKETMSKNAILRINNRRGKRMSEAEALTWLDRQGFVRDDVTFRTVHRCESRETIVTHWDRTSRNEDGSPRFDRARLQVSFSI